MLEDKLRKLRGYYYEFPDWLKLLVASPYKVIPPRFRYGRAYGEFESLLSKTSSFTKQDIEDLQFLKLKSTLDIAFREIPFYQKKYSEFGLNELSFKYLDDIKKFPFLTKREVKENYEDLINRQIDPSRHLVTTTGGSTAAPMRFLHLNGITRTKEKVFITNGWSRLGYQLGDRVVQIKGRSVGQPSKNIFWEFEPIQNYLEMDSNYLTEENIPLYLREIKKFNGEFLIAFPSSIYLIAKYLKGNGIDAPKFKAIFLASENVYSWQRELLEQVFNCRIFSHYGHSEMVLLGMECEVSKNLHFFPEYGYLELIDSSGEEVTVSGGIGELVGTSFDNPLMPFIRYKTEDFGVLNTELCSCGRNHTMLSDVEGRLQEFIVTSDDRLISVCTMGAAHFDVLDYVWETQYYQEKKGELTFLVVPKEGFGAEHKLLIKEALERKTGFSCRVTVKCVDAIEKTVSGKHMMLVQKISKNVLERGQEHIL